MKDLFLKIRALLMQVESLNYVDWDYGQLNAVNPAILYPAALITITYPDCQDTVTGSQRVRALISIALAFDLINDQTSSSFDNDTSSASLDALDTIDQVYAKLQSYYDDEVEELSRKSLTEMKRSDRIKVFLIPFDTYFDDVAG